MTTRFSDVTRGEFDLMATWTADVVSELGPKYHVPGACRGSANPALLAWLAESLEVTPETRFADIGAGMGGPAAWIAQRYGVEPTVIEPMPLACRAAVDLFGLRTVTADAEELPIVDGTFDVVWLMGVLDTVEHPDGLLAEIKRVLVPGGRIGVLDYVRVGACAGADELESNSFSTQDELLARFNGAGFLRLGACNVAALPDAPVAWQLHIGRVDDVLAERHGDDPRWQEARAQERQFASLLADGVIEPFAVHGIAL